MIKKPYEIVKKINSDTIPNWLLRIIEKPLGLFDRKLAKWASLNPFVNGPHESEYKSPIPYRLGILKDFWHQHWPYIQVCRDLKVSYSVIEFTKSDWIEQIKSSECDAFLAWPSVYPSIFKQMFDERLRVLEQEMGEIVCPTANEIWIHESKRRVAYWLKANNVPHPETGIFYNEKEALEFIHSVKLPVIFKPDRGSSARGMEVFRDRSKLLKYVKDYFKKGLLRKYDDIRDRQWGSIVLQRYIENVDEWRMIVIDTSYFGYKKGKQGDFHSGSKLVEFADPPRDLLDFTEMLIQIGKFSSMSFDILQKKDGTYLVNEFHPVFGRDPWDHSMEVNGKPGRYIRDNTTGQWYFEEGIFTENSCCNLRVKMLLEKLMVRNVQSKGNNI